MPPVLTKSSAGNTLRRLVRRVFRGKAAPVDMRRGGDVETALANGKTVLLDLPLSNGIGLHHFPLHMDGPHPFVRAVRLASVAPARNSEHEQNIISAALNEYYERVKPGSAAEWLGVNEKTLQDLPPLAAVFPWQTKGPSQWQQARSKGIQNENRLAGNEIGIAEGWHACGPVSAAKLEVEAQRLQRLLQSIRTEGLLRNDGRDGDMEAVLLKGDKVSRWWLNYGHHRAAVCAALRFENVPVRIVGIINPADAEQWTQVQSGIFSTDVAKKLVARLLRGELPEICGDWQTFIKPAS
jgi:hypothetical protein